jgi:hypothetical protein
MQTAKRRVCEHRQALHRFEFELKLARQSILPKRARVLERRVAASRVSPLEKRDTTAMASIPRRPAEAHAPRWSWLTETDEGSTARRRPSVRAWPRL